MFIIEMSLKVALDLNSLRERHFELIAQLTKKMQRKRGQRKKRIEEQIALNTECLELLENVIELYDKAKEKNDKVSMEESLCKQKQYYVLLKRLNPKLPIHTNDHYEYRLKDEFVDKSLHNTNEFPVTSGSGIKRPENVEPKSKVTRLETGSDSLKFTKVNEPEVEDEMTKMIVYLKIDK